ncbi:MAG: hypothetical protein JNG83_01595 [Opitutaceae bacterium]|nr:hypothetical protein [Opitutaceae bacterium]
MARSAPLTRREFARRLARQAAGAVALGGIGLQGRAAPASPAAAPAERRGVWRVTHLPRALTSPVSTPPGETWRYLIVYPFQVAPRLAGLSLNIKPSPGPGQDFPVGGDILLFDDLQRLEPAEAIPLFRNHDAPNPHADGKLAHMTKPPAQIGFVPWGARRADGRPHPHAGTGFALTSPIAQPVDDSEGTLHFPDRIGRRSFTGSRSFRYLECYQLRYDGRTFTGDAGKRFAAPPEVDGCLLRVGGMGAAIPDGDDLLIGMQAQRIGSDRLGAGLARWRRIDGEWRPVAFTLITPEDNSMEPTLVRDLDGSLLFLARAPRHLGPPVRIWRQAGTGGPWELRINVNGITNSTPITLNQAADGTPYVLLNLRQPDFRLPPDVPSDGGISRLEPKGRRGERSTICLLALNEARDGFCTPLIVKDPLVDYGVPPHGTVWAADHATGSVVQLADGQWHGVFGYRLLEWIENTHFAPPTPQTGCYLDEVISLGPPRPPWNLG